MNCKPGDLAVLIRSVCGNEGGLVRVLDAIHAEPGEWRVEALSRLRGEDGLLHDPGEWGWALDRDLRPILDPGEHARDETLDWCQVPTPDLVTDCIRGH